MLVLTRKIGQRITIGENVELTVLQINGKRVRLGITAPRAVAVHRAEVQCHGIAENRGDCQLPSSMLPARWPSFKLGSQGDIAMLFSQKERKTLLELGINGPGADVDTDCLNQLFTRRLVSIDSHRQVTLTDTGQLIYGELVRH